MAKLKAEDFYKEVSELVDNPYFTKLTKTGISSDYKSVFEFAEAYFDARIKLESNGDKLRLPRPLEAYNKAHKCDCVSEYIEWFLKQEKQ